MSTALAPTSDESLLRALHDEHAHALWSYAISLTRGDHARAQDVVQETLLRAWRTPAVLDQSRGSARGWLFTVAKRIAIDEWRSARSRHEFVAEQLPERETDDPYDAVAEHTVDRHIVVAALRTLSPEHRDVILECYYRGSSVAQASAALGVPPGTIKSRTHYALRALRTAMDEMGGTQ
jgi:RNA polymerase sigma-70 factor (ECF subfamily)